jgi:hypothetical protein
VKNLRLAAVAAAAFMTLAPNLARAVSPAADAEFQEGKRLMAKGNFSEACAHFAQSYDLEASSGTLLNLALCHEKEGKTATAWGEYREAARLAQDQGRNDRAAAASEKLAALQPKVPRVTTVAAKPIAGLNVATEERSLTEGGFGVAVPVDPGVHQVTASAPRHRSWTTTVQISEGEQRTLEIPALEEEPAPVVVSVVTKGAEIAPTIVASSPPKASSRFSSLELYTAIGGGVLVLGGTVSWGIGYAKLASGKQACNHPPGCPDYEARVSTINTLKGIAIGSWIAGGAALAVAGLHFGYRTRTRSLDVAIDPAIDPVNGRFLIRGVF